VTEVITEVTEVEVVKIEKGIEDDGGDNKIPSTIQILKLI
jgi:hypothetical protein